MTEIPENLTTAQAVIIVEKLIGKGVLKIITADHSCMPRGRGEPKSNYEQAVCANYPIPADNPYHYRLEDPSAIEVKGKYIKVWSKRGDWTYGLPSKVIRKLCEAALVNRIQAYSMVEEAAPKETE